MANWLLTCGQVQALVQQYLAPPGFIVGTCPDLRCDGIMGVIHDGSALSPRVEFHLYREDLIVSADQMLQRLRNRIQKQIDALCPQPPAPEPDDFDRTG